MNKKLLRNDIILITAVSAVIALSAFAIYKPDKSEYITVTVNNQIYRSYRLDGNICEKIGNTGVVLEIRDGTAKIIYSDCPDKLCLNTPGITQLSPVGASIVCLPNKVAAVKANKSPKSKEADGIAG